MDSVTNEMLAQALIVIKQDLEELKPIPLTGPLTRRQAERLVDMDRGVRLLFSGEEAIFGRGTSSGQETWKRKLVREEFPFPLFTNS